MEQITFNQFVSAIRHFNNYKIELLSEKTTPNGIIFWVAKITTSGNYLTPQFLKYCVKYNIGIECKNNEIIIDNI